MLSAQIILVSLALVVAMVVGVVGSIAYTRRRARTEAAQKQLQQVDSERAPAGRRGSTREQRKPIRPASTAVSTVASRSRVPTGASLVACACDPGTIDCSSCADRSWADWVAQADREATWEEHGGDVIRSLRQFVTQTERSSERWQQLAGWRVWNRALGEATIRATNTHGGAVVSLVARFADGDRSVPVSLLLSDYFADWLGPPHAVSASTFSQQTVRGVPHGATSRPQVKLASLHPAPIEPRVVVLRPEPLLRCDTAFALGAYIPSRNPDHYSDQLTQMVLRLKRRERDAIAYFARMIDPLLARNVVMVAVPSSDPAREPSGVKLLAQRLAEQGRIDGTGCLGRSEAIDAQSRGGQRSRERHERTIVVAAPDLLWGKAVVLLDDVRTSGTTLDVCRAKLKLYQPASITEFVLGQTR